MINSVLNVCKKLLYEEPFLGSILVQLQKEITTRIPTACVALNGTGFKLLVNPDFWESLTPDQQRGLIKHELYHIIFFHLTDYGHLKDHETANIAMDIYINQKIPKDHLPPNPCIWDGFKNLKPDMDTNWYYQQLAQNLKDKSCQATKDAIDKLKSGQSDSKDQNGKPISLPQHKWDEIRKTSDAMKKIISKSMQVQIKEVLSNMDDEALKKIGSTHGELVEILKRLEVIIPPKFDWAGFTRNFVGQSTRVDVKKTSRKKSKRFPGMRGNRETYYSHVLLALDSSASFSTKELQEAQNEMHHLYKLGHDVTVVICDTRMGKPFKFDPRKDIEIEGRGGTSFQPVIDYYSKERNKYSCLIYFTDGEADVPENPRGPILWVHSSKCYRINEGLPGIKIKLP